MGLVGVIASKARADDQAAFSHLLADQTLQQQIVDAAGQSTVMLQKPCPSAKYTLRNKLSVQTAIAFDSSGHIVAGDWKHTVEEQGCGQTRILNVLAVVKGLNTVATIPLLPGTTHAGSVLQKDAVQYAAQVVATVPGGQDPGCKTVYVEDTQFLSQDSAAVAGGKAPPWREIRTLVSCVQMMRVPMLFVPDSTGTPISAGPNNAVKVMPLSAKG